MQQQQHLMQMQPAMMASSYYPNSVTTDHIQQYLDENKSLILKIVESQNSGKLSECAENQARLQRNLMYLAAIADSQPQPTMHSQYGQSGMMQSNAYLQHQQAQQMTSQSLMAARSSMLYNQHHYSALQQQQALQSHLSMSSGGSHMMQNEGSSSGSGFLDLRGMTGGSGGSKQDVGGSSMDGRETLYLKAGDHNN